MANFFSFNIILSYMANKFAERITAHKTPLNMHYWRGFSFLI